MNLWDVILIALIAAAAGFAVWRIIANKKKGKSSCGCDCGHCAQSCGRKRV